MDPITCCLLGICCPPGSPEQLATLEKLLTAHTKDEAKAKRIAFACHADLEKLGKKLAKMLAAEN